jgi:hypothetical protein
LSLVVLLGAAAGCCGLLVLAGCSSDPRGKLYPVTGKITLPDGTPCPKGNVTFIPLEADPKAPSFPASEGAIREDGSYTLSTKGKPGVPAGKYRVVLSSGRERRALAKAWSVVPLKYTSEAKSPLEVEVAENKPEGGYDLKLQPQSGQRR